jgi:hypothetical protein
LSAAAATLALAALLVLVSRMDSTLLEEGEGRRSDGVGLLIITKKYFKIIDYYKIAGRDNYVSYPAIRYDIVFMPYGKASYDKT